MRNAYTAMDDTVRVSGLEKTSAVAIGSHQGNAGWQHAPQHLQRAAQG
jgi:hypothetical protein